MFRQLAIVAVLAAVAFCYPIESYNDIPEEFKSLIPEEVSTHLKSITPEERDILKELAKRHGEFKNENEFLAALKEKSPELHAKAEKLQAIVAEKVQKLGAEGQEFVNKVIATARKYHTEYLAGKKPTIADLKKVAKERIEEFNKLSDASKEEFKTHFPILTGFFTNPKVKALAEKYMNAEN
ncbi:unnamed protein product [Auanema sp. JU1783]|nr:unnamed protein product [Auanema sp. JU1783]